MFAPPPQIEAEVYAELPEALRRTGAPSQWAGGQPGRGPSPHSLLEGPAFDREGRLYCVDVVHGRVFRLDERRCFHTIADYEGEPNGLRFHKDGRLFGADFRNGIISIDRETGRVDVICARHRVERFKAVNDLVFGSDGALYFTDQALTGVHEPAGRVFRLGTDGRVERLIDNAPSPNGLVLNLDESELFVAMTRGNCVWRAPLLPEGGVAKVGVFIQLSGGHGPDGLALDEAGNLAVAHVGLGCVWLFSPHGEPLLRIVSPRGRKTTNIAYGGPDRRSLFITEAESGTILTARMPIPGRRLFGHM